MDQELEEMIQEITARNATIIAQSEGNSERFERMEQRTISFLARNQDLIESWKNGGTEEPDWDEEGKTDGDPKSEIAEILADPDHAYNNKKASRAEHEEAVTYMNQLIARKHRRG